MFLAQRLATAKPWYIYRFLFIPSTIGSITWRALNQPLLDIVERSGIPFDLVAEMAGLVRDADLVKEVGG